MPKKAKELTVKQVAALANKPTLGFHPVGGTGSEGLALQVKSEHAASWILRTTIAGKRRDIGLGSFPLISLAEAREHARELRKSILRGIDPIQQKRDEQSASRASERISMTFRELAKEYVSKKSDDYKGKDVAKRIAKLENQLEIHVFPTIGDLLLNDIKRPHIQKILDPIWKTKTETANRVRLHVEKILDLAAVKELRDGTNPARWKGYLDHIYSKPSAVTETQNRPALPVDELPAFMAELRTREGYSPLLLEFTILTAARPGEARAARWEQIDLEAKTWTISGKEMKEGKEHVVPLCSRLVDMLEDLPKDQPYVFPGQRSLQMSDVVVTKLAKRLAPGITVHGFRSTFKDWARIHARGYRDEVSELALAHVGTDATRAAYARDKLVDERRKMMNDYERFCERGPVSGDVIPLKDRA